MNLPQSQASSSSPWSTCCISVWCSPWSMYCIVVWCSPCSLGCTTFVFIGCSFWKNQYDPLLKFSLHHWHFVWCSPWNPVWISVEFSVLYCIMRPYRRYMCLVSAHARKGTYAHEKKRSIPPESFIKYEFLRTWHQKESRRRPKLLFPLSHILIPKWVESSSISSSAGRDWG